MSQSCLTLLLLLVAAVSCVDVDPPPEAPPVTQTGCALYCLILPSQNERVNFTDYDNLPCSHFVYGFGSLEGTNHVRGPSSEDESTNYDGNFRELRKLKKRNPSAKVLLGVRLARDSHMSSTPSQKEIATTLIRTVRDLHLDGLFLLAGRPFLDNSRFSHFFQAIKSANNALPTTLAVPLSLLSQSFSHVTEAQMHVDALYIMSAPEMTRIADVDPLLPSAATPPERTISFMLDKLAESGVAKRKVIIGLTAGSVEYRNFMADRIDEEAEGRQVSLQETCGTMGVRDVNAATSTQSLKTESRWLSSNAPIDNSMGRKVRWLTSSGYGGVGIQSLAHDDPKGICSLDGGAFPALRMAADNMQCRAADHVKGCTILCYVNTIKPLENLPPAACSHIVVEASFSALLDVKLSSEGEATARWLRNWSAAPKPKLMISLGSRLVSDIWRLGTSNKLTRKALIMQIQAILSEWQGSGIEISWTQSMLVFPYEEKCLEDFLMEMREIMGNGTTIALAVSPDSSFGRKFESMTSLNRTVDLVVLHSHRFHSTQQPVTGHHSPLFQFSEALPEEGKTVEGLVAEWVERLGMARSKIVVGITAEPLSMPLTDTEETEFSTPFGMKANRTSGLLLTNNPRLRVNGSQVCEFESDEATYSEFVEELGVPFLVKNGLFVAFDNERSVRMKATWSSQNRLGGVALFEAQMDNPDGDCPSEAFPLLKAIKKTLMCQRCAEENDVDPCTPSFITSCSYRLPTTNEQSMSSSEIPFDRCSDIVLEDVTLNGKGEVRFRDPTAETAMRTLERPKMSGKRLIVVVTCDMRGTEFAQLLRHGPTTVRSIVEFVSSFKLSGVEIHCAHLITSAHKDAFASLLMGLRTSLVESTPAMMCPRTLTLRLPVTTDLTESYNVSTLNALRNIVLLGFMNPISANTARVSSPLFPSENGGLDIHTVISKWLAVGVERKKILIQIPTVATIQTISSHVAEIGAEATNLTLITQAQACEVLKFFNTPVTTLWDQIGAYAVTHNNDWVTLQTPETVEYKVSYAIRENLGGTSLSSLNEDDWAGVCGKGAFPLLAAATNNCRLSRP